MIIDSSAIVAMFMREPEAVDLATALAEAAGPAVSAVTLVESSIVLGHRMCRDARPLLDVFLRHHEIEVIAFSAEHWQVAAQAWWQFGKGRHKARLNFGDCAAYATAKLARAPLLFKGDDFSETDVEVAAYGK